MAYIERRVNIKNKTSWRVQIRLAGYEPITATFDSKKDAKEWADDTEYDLRYGRFEAVKVSKNKTVNDMIDKYQSDWLEIANLSPRYVEYVHRYLNWWRKEIGGHTLFNVSPSVVAACRTELQKGKRGKAMRQAATVNNYLSALSNAFTKAKDEWGWTDENPFKQLQWLDANERTRFAQASEIPILLEECGKEDRIPLLAIVAVAMATGMRKGELTTAEIKYLDVQRQCLFLPETKNKTPRDVPIQGYAWELLKQWVDGDRKKIGSKWLFPNSYGTNHVYEVVYRYFKEACDRAGIEDMHFHDLRHTTGAQLAMSGASQRLIQDMLGHKTMKASARYQHINNDSKNEKAKEISQQLFG